MLTLIRPTQFHTHLVGLLLLMTSPLPAAQPVQPWLSFPETQFSPATHVPDGVHFSFNLGTRRQNWTHARWAVHELPEPIDLRGMSGLLLEVVTDTPRRDAGIYVALREASGSWHSHPWAVGLSAASGVNTGIAEFRHFSSPLFHSPPRGRFQDANNRLDLDEITAVAIGVVNPLGVGTVSFTLRRLDLLQPVIVEEAPASLEVTGHLLRVNGTEMLPSGLFGGFHLGSDHHRRFRLAADRTIFHDGVSGNPRLGSRYTPIHINTVGDRVRPSPRLTRADWEARSEALGRSMGRTALEAGKPLWVEYWNEPYLNWANFNRANFIPRFFDESRATEGGPVHIRHDGSEAPHLIWTQDRAHFLPFMISGATARAGGGRLDHWRRGRTADGRVLSTSAQPFRSMEFYYSGTWLPESHPPLDVPDGETYEFRGQTLTAFTPWHIIDTTQFTYWSGKGMLKFYIDPLLAFARGMREENPEAKLIIGWGNRPSEDHWAGFFQLYQPVIDAAIDYIHGYNDHDYGGHPANMSANYEVVTAYAYTRHNRWLYAYNTEAGTNTDPQAYQAEGTSSADVTKFEWVTRVMLHRLSQVPDKARVILHFGDGRHTGGRGSAWWSDTGEGIAMEMLIQLRGRLLHTRGMDNELFLVASIDGTDPMAPRPEFLPEGKVMTVALLNDRTTPRQVQLRFDAPAGAVLGDGQVRYSEVVNAAIQVHEAAAALTGQQFVDEVVLGPRELRVYTFPILNHAELDEDPDTWPGARPRIVRRQFFGHEMLRDVHPDTPVLETLSLPEELLAKATHAEFSFVAQRLPEGMAQLTLNGKDIPLPALLPPENNANMLRFPLNPELLQTANEVAIRVPNEDHPGFFLGVWSLWLEFPE